MKINIQEIKDLSIGLKRQKGKQISILKNITTNIRRGETVGIVGESGSGKSTLALAMMGYIKHGLFTTGGECLFKSQNLLSLNNKELEDIRGRKIAMIPQNAGQALTPNLKIGYQIEEALRLHTEYSKAEREQKISELLNQVRLPSPKIMTLRYPHELSGGQQQRVAVAMALAGNPELLLLDEPTTGLDVTTQAHVLELLKDIAKDTGTSMVYVSHDLGAIAQVCDRVIVMYAGEIVLEGPVRKILKEPIHPYTYGLLKSIPKLSLSGLPDSMPGSQPQPGNIGSGCSFYDRCNFSDDECKVKVPELEYLPEIDTSVRCFNHSELTSKTNEQKITNDSKKEITIDEILDLKDVSISYAKQGIMDQFGMQEALKTLGLSEINKGCSTGNNWLGNTANLIESYSPVDGKLIGKVAVSTKEDYEAAIAAGQKAYKTWRVMPAPLRGEIVRQFGNKLRDYKEPLGKLVSYEIVFFPTIARESWGLSRA